MCSTSSNRFNTLYEEDYGYEPNISLFNQTRKIKKKIRQIEHLEKKTISELNKEQINKIHKEVRS